MTNANADHRHISGLGIANEIFARWDKTMIFIRTMPRFRNQPTIADVYRSKKININHFEGFKCKPLACQKVTKNCIIVTKLCLNFILGMASQQNTNFHMSPYNLIYLNLVCRSTSVEVEIKPIFCGLFVEVDHLLLRKPKPVVCD